MFDIPPDDWRFALTMILTCVPFMIIIGLFQTRTFNVLLDKVRSSLRASLRHIAQLSIFLSRMLQPKDSASSSSQGVGTGGSQRNRNIWPNIDDGPPSASELGLPPTPMRPPRGRKGNLLAFGLRSKSKTEAGGEWWTQWWPSGLHDAGMRPSTTQNGKCAEGKIEHA
jgi:hypothetical protein